VTNFRKNLHTIFYQNPSVTELSSASKEVTTSVAAKAVTKNPYVLLTLYSVVAVNISSNLRI
jgi:hypothetical protein